MFSNYQIKTLQFVGGILAMVLLLACSITTRSPEDSFLEVYKQIWSVENEFHQDALPSFEELKKSGHTNYLSIFLSRIEEARDGRQSLLNQSANSLQNCYQKAGGGDPGRSACRKLLKKAVFQFGPVYSKHVFFLHDSGPVVTDDEWLKWAQECMIGGSTLFKWRYDLKECVQ